MDWIKENLRCQEALRTGDFQQAESSIRSALALYQTSAPKLASDAAELYSLLGEVLLLKGALQEAEGAFSRSEAFFSRTRKAKVYRRGVNNLGLGEICLKNGDKERALHLFKKARVWIATAYPAEHLYRKRLCAHLEARPVMDFFPWQENERRLLEKLKETTEKFSASKQLPLDQLSGVVKWEALIERAVNCLHEETKEEWVQAYKYANEAFELARTGFPLVHEGSSNSMCVMAAASEKMRLYQQAEDLYACSLEVLDRIFGKDSLESAMLRLRLAHLFRSTEQYEKANSFFMSAARVLVNHPEVDQEDFQKNAAQFVKMLDQKRASDSAEFQFNEASKAFNVRNYEKALISVIGAERALSKHFAANHDKSLAVLELKRQIFQAIDWKDGAELLEREIATFLKEREQEQKSWDELRRMLPVFTPGLRFEEKGSARKQELIQEELIEVELS